MKYIQRLNKDVRKSNEIYRQRSKEKQWLNKDVRKSNEIYTKAKQRCKEKQ